jgi:hypothetical protein
VPASHQRRRFCCLLNLADMRCAFALLRSKHHGCAVCDGVRAQIRMGAVHVMNALAPQHLSTNIRVTCHVTRRMQAGYKP